MSKHRNHRNGLMALGVLAAAFAGGAFSHWMLGGIDEASAKDMTEAGIKLKLDNKGPVYTRKLQVFDGGYRKVASLDLSGLRLYGASGREWARLASSGAGGGLSLLDAGGRTRVVVDTSGIKVSDAAGRVRVAIEGSGLILYDAGGKESARLGVGRDGKAGLLLPDSSGALRKVDFSPASQGGTGPSKSAPPSRKKPTILKRPTK